MNDKRQFRSGFGWLKPSAAKRLRVAAAIAAAACCSIAPSVAVAGDYGSNGVDSNGAQPSTFGTNAHDATITTKVKATLADTRDLSSHDIHVRTRGGMVLLTGSVPDAQQRARAISAVRKVNGVQGVRDQLTLRQ